MAIPDRTSEAPARSILTKLMPDEHLRQSICHDLALYWRYAKQNFPTKSFVTLAPNYVRLNVGMVEVFVIRSNEVLVLVDRLFNHPTLEDGPYASEPDAHPIRFDHSNYVALADGFHSATFSIINKLGRTHKHPTAAKAHSLNLATLLEKDFPYDSALDQPEEIPIEYREGNSIQVFINRYERDPKARDACIHHFGTSVCQVCGFDFFTQYGEIGRNFIHIHHLQPIANAEGNRPVNPETDLLPVCPNCHAMLHTRKPNPWTPEELAEIMNAAKESAD